MSPDPDSIDFAPLAIERQPQSGRDDRQKPLPAAKVDASSNVVRVFQSVEEMYVFRRGSSS